MRPTHFDPRKIKAGDYVYTIDCPPPFTSNGTETCLCHFSPMIVKCRVVKWQSSFNSASETRAIVWAGRMLNTATNKEFGVAASSIGALFHSPDDALDYVKKKIDESYETLSGHEKRQVSYKGIFHALR